MFRCVITMLGLAAVLAAQPFRPLFNGKDLTGWKTIIKVGKDHKEDDGKVFSVADGTIVVSGNPAGYFYTAKSYKNYIVRFDWKFSNDSPKSNSGLLVHITGDHKVWPKSIEVQGMQGDHGHIFPIQGVKGAGPGKTDKKAQKEAIKPGEWNTTEVTVKNGMITSKINGKLISTGGPYDVTEGPFGLQSEGTKMWFKNIKIKVLD